jgi:hypothetical protein
LVILGLLVGGILSGQALIRAAELRAVTTEYSRYKTAVATFRDKYFALPGDMINATSFWGTAGTCPGTNASPSTTPATCNGDGNGSFSPGVSTSNEYYRFWQHLANASLIEGTYAGVSNNAAASSAVSSVGLNIPAGRISGSGWNIYDYGTQSIASVLLFEGTYNTAFELGAFDGATIYDAPIIKPEEAWNIDTKLDDGKPGTGIVRTYEGYGGSCSDLAASAVTPLAATSIYLLSNSNRPCNLIFNM